MRKPSNFQALLDEKLLEELQKAIFIKATNIHDFFNKYKKGHNKRYLEYDQFKDAINALELKWSGNERTRAFQNIDKSMHDSI